MRNKEVIDDAKEDCTPNNGKNKKEVSISEIYEEKQNLQQRFYPEEKVTFCFSHRFYAEWHKTKHPEGAH